MKEKVSLFEYPVLDSEANILHHHLSMLPAPRGIQVILIKVIIKAKVNQVLCLV